MSASPSTRATALLDHARKAATCVYLATEKPVADDIAATLNALLAEVERLERERDGLREALNTLHTWADGFENPRTGMGAGLHAEMYPMLHPGGRRYLLEITRAALKKGPADGRDDT